MTIAPADPTPATFTIDPAEKFATVAMVDTNGGLRGQMVSTSSLTGIVKPAWAWRR